MIFGLFVFLGLLVFVTLFVFVQVVRLTPYVFILIYAALRIIPDTISESTRIHGIPPSPLHTLQLIEEMKRDGVSLIVVEPYFNLKTPEAIVNQLAGGRVLVLAPSLGGMKEVTDYLELFEYNVNLLADALRQAAGR